jgi:hypothetical protein
VKKGLTVSILVPEFPQDDIDPLITFGVGLQWGLQVAISRSSLSGHMQVRGITGAGTSRSLFPIILQLLKANRSAPRAGGDPIVVLDLRKP